MRPEDLTAATAALTVILLLVIYRQVKKGFLGKQIRVEESGVWVIKRVSYKGDITRPEMKFIREVRAEADAIQNQIKEKINLQVKVQPVVVFGNPKADLKFRFFQIEGVDVVQNNWLDKLIQDYPAQKLDNQKVTLIRELVSVHKG